MVAGSTLSPTSNQRKLIRATLGMCHRDETHYNTTYSHQHFTSKRTACFMNSTYSNCCFYTASTQASTQAYSLPSFPRRNHAARGLSRPCRLHLFLLILHVCVCAMYVKVCSTVVVSVKLGVAKTPQETWYSAAKNSPPAKCRPPKNHPRLEIHKNSLQWAYHEQRK